MVTLLTPKMLGVLRAFIDWELLRTVNPLRVLLGAVAETILSALYAPIMMMMQVRQVSEILIGQDSGWTTQSRKHARTPWGTLFRRHWLQTLSGIVVSVVLLYVSPPLFLWMSPALVGLVCALPLSAASGSVVLAKIARFLGFLTVPEEVDVPRVIALRDEAEARLEELLDGVTIERLLSDEIARQRHFAAVLPRPAATRGHPDVMFITARAKLGDAHTAAEALVVVVAAGATGGARRSRPVPRARAARQSRCPRSAGAALGLSGRAGGLRRKIRSPAHPPVRPRLVVWLAARPSMPEQNLGFETLDAGGRPLGWSASDGAGA